MEDNRNVPERSLRRRFEAHRLEDQLWALAYEHVWPVIRRSLSPAHLAQRLQGSQVETIHTIARRA
jgi:hypothetical protein